MALKNAFEGLATESQVERLIAALESLHTDTIARAELSHETPLARDANDRLRVEATGLVSLNSLTAMQFNTGYANTYPLWYGIGGPNAMDVREDSRYQSVANFQAARSRWVFT
jgi:hypothetical protein